MKLNRLFTPLLTLATVATVVTPVVTSCGNGTNEIAHVKVCAVDELTAKDKHVQYLLILDRDDYDVNGFKITTSVSDNDTTGAKDQDFSTTWTIDGDHLIVNVMYLGEEPNQDISVKLNINVKYGTSWSRDINVKMRYEAIKGLLLTWRDAKSYLAYDLPTCLEGSSYTFIAKMSDLPENYEPAYNFRVMATRLLSDESNARQAGFKVAFKNIKIKLNGKYLSSDQYTLTPSEQYEGYITATLNLKLSSTDILTFECIECSVKMDSTYVSSAQFY